MDRALPNADRRVPRWLIIAGALLSIGLLLWLVAAVRGAAAVPDDLQWTEVRRGPLEDRVSGVGEFISTGQRQLVAVDPGSVQSTHKAVGDPVKAGESILRMANQELALELESAESDVRRLELEQEQHALDDQETLERAQIAVEDARYELRTANSEREMNRALYRRQLISRLKNETYEATAEQAQSRYDSAARLLQLVENRQRRSGALRDETTGLARKKRDRLRERVAGLELLAPIDGWVKSVAVGIGDRVAANTVLASVGPLAPDAVRLLFPQESLARLKPGVAIELHLGDRRFPAELLRVRPDPQQGLIVTEAVVAELPGDARIGMAVRGDALLGQMDQAVYARSPFLPSSESGRIDLYRDRRGRIERLRLSGVKSVNGALVFADQVLPGDRIAVDDQARPR